MRSNSVTLLVMILKSEVSLRAQRGNPLRKIHYFYEIAALRSQ